MTLVDYLKERTVTSFWRMMPDWQQEHLVAFQSQTALVERNSKYFAITTALYLASTFNPFARIFSTRPVGVAPGLWTAYHFCREIDDIADGDKELPQGYATFSELQDALNTAMDTNKYPPSGVGVLLRGTVRDMREYHNVDVREDLSAFLDAMAYEQQRRLNKTISTREELYQLYQNSFGIPQNIAFIGAGSRVRSYDIPELAELQGRIYAVRDLSDELKHGIIFVPQEVLPLGMTADQLCSDYHALPEIRAWIQEEISEGKRMIAKLREKELDKTGRIMVNFLVQGIERYIQHASS